MKIDPLERWAFDQVSPEPRVGRQLQRPAHEVTDDVAVADDDVDLFGPGGGVGAVNVAAEAGLDAGALRKVLLQGQLTPKNDFHAMVDGFRKTHVWLRVPSAGRRLRWENWAPFSDEVTA